MKIDEYALNLSFYKVETIDGPVWWRECVLHEDMVPGTQGYMLIYKDGSCCHTYSYPPNFLCVREVMA